MPGVALPFYTLGLADSRRELWDAGTLVPRVREKRLRLDPPALSHRDGSGAGLPVQRASISPDVTCLPGGEPCG